MECWQNLGFTDPAELVALARLAEDVGMDGVTMPEHLVVPLEVSTPNPFVPGGGAGFGPETPFPDPWVAFGALGAVTTRLRFLANVWVLPLRSVFTTARAVATAAVLTGGRVELGVGVGWLREEFDAVGASFGDRGARADEQLDLLLALLSGEPTSRAGRFHQVPPVVVRPAPPRPVPVLVGGVSDTALRRAARAGGWIGVNHPEDELVAILERLARARRDVGRADGPFRVVVSRPPTFDAGTVRRYGDAGVSGIVNRPLRFLVGDGAGPAAWRSAVEAFVDTVRAGAGDKD